MGTQQKQNTKANGISDLFRTATQDMLSGKKGSLIMQDRNPLNPSKTTGVLPSAGVKKSRQQSLNALSTNKVVT